MIQMISDQDPDPDHIKGTLPKWQFKIITEPHGGGGVIVASGDVLMVGAQGPEEMCLSLEHQNPSKTSEKMGYFDRVTSLHIL